MPFLSCRQPITMKQIINQTSLRHIKMYHISPFFNSLPKRQLYKNVKKLFWHVKRVSLSFPQDRKGSMTVEAALAVPFFLFFFMTLLSVFEMFRLHSSLTAALCETGTQMAVYGYVYHEAQQEQGTDFSGILTNVALSSGYARTQVIQYLGKEYLEASPLTLGTFGLQFLESSVMDKEDRIDLKVTYGVSPPGFFPGVKELRLCNRFYARAWTGYDVTEQKESEEQGEYVYITETGTVYHRNPNCTHLFLSVRKVFSQMVENLRNQSGGKYYPCESCAGGNIPTEVYITSQGTRYHTSKTCSRLKRTIQKVLLDRVEDRKACSRCGG